MGNWILMESETELKEQIAERKKRCRGHFYTNYQSLSGILDEALNYTEIFWKCENDNVYIIKRHDDFYKLIYAVGNIDDFSIEYFPKSVQNSILTCDIIELEGKEKQSCMVEHLENMNFQIYKKYHMWECANRKIKALKIRMGIQISVEKSQERLSRIYDFFDPYADMLPSRKEFDGYISSRNALSVFYGESYAGSEIYKIEGNTVLVEYYYAMDGFRGAGGILMKACLDKWFNENKVNKVFAWISDDNLPSIETSKSAGFVQTNQYKLTMVRRGKA